MFARPRSTRCCNRADLSRAYRRSTRPMAPRAHRPRLPQLSEPRKDRRRPIARLSPILREMRSVRRAYLLTLFVDFYGRTLEDPRLREGYRTIADEMWKLDQHVFDTLPARERIDEKTGRRRVAFTRHAVLGPHLVLANFVNTHTLPDMMRELNEFDAELVSIVMMGPTMGDNRDAERARKAQSLLHSALLFRTKILRWDGTKGSTRRWSRAAQRVGIKLSAGVGEARWLCLVHEAVRMLGLSSMASVKDFGREYRRRLNAAKTQVR